MICYRTYSTSELGKAPFALEVLDSYREHTFEEAHLGHKLVGAIGGVLLLLVNGIGGGGGGGGIRAAGSSDVRRDGGRVGGTSTSVVTAMVVD